MPGARNAGEALHIKPPSGFRGPFRTDDTARAVYSEAAGIGRIKPAAVAVPVDVEDICRLVQWAGDTGHPLIPRGSGSSMAGGAIGPGIIVDLSRLRTLDEPNVENRSVRAEAGVLRGEVQRAAASVGSEGGGPGESRRLRFPVDPSSGEFCTIAGMTATNAAGPHSLLHGAMRPWVLAIDCVFSDGSRGTIRRGEEPPRSIAPVHRFSNDVSSRLLDGGWTPSHAAVLKDSSGYAVATYAQTQDLVDLLVGSEGTLALFTAVEVALAPANGGTASLFVSFRDLERAVTAAVAARERGAAACELLDRTFLTIAARAGRPLPVESDSEAALLVEVEAEDSSGAMQAADALRALFRDLGADHSMVALGPGHEAELWSFRHAASPAIARMDPLLRSMQFVEDAAVPPSALAAYVRGVREILERNDTVGVIFGHAGDAHVHVNPLVDVQRSDWRARVERILLDVTNLVARLGGTTSGEHGDGRLRTPLMDRVWSDAELELFAAIKGAFDPRNILNPGVKVPIPGQQAIDVIKYDPGLDLPPSAAREALNIIDRDRAYARFRLDLV